MVFTNWLSPLCGDLRRDLQDEKSPLLPRAGGAWLQMTSTGALVKKLWVFGLLLKNYLILSHLICVSAIRNLSAFQKTS